MPVFNTVLLTFALLLPYTASAQEDDCLSASGTSLRESFRRADVVMLGRVRGTRPMENVVFGEMLAVESTERFKGTSPEVVELGFQNYQSRLPEPLLNDEYLFALKELDEDDFSSEQLKGNEHRMYSTLSAFAPWSSLWDPVSLDVSCPHWRTLLADWSAQLETALLNLPKYTDLWLRIVSRDSDLPRDEVLKRIRDMEVNIRQFRTAIQFRVSYTIVVDWVVIENLHDKFTVFHYAPYDANAPKEVWLEEQFLYQEERAPKVPHATYFVSEERFRDHLLAVMGERDLPVKFKVSPFDARAARELADGSGCLGIRVDMGTGETRTHVYGIEYCRSFDP